MRTKPGMHRRYVRYIYAMLQQMTTLVWEALEICEHLQVPVTANADRADMPASLRRIQRLKQEMVAEECRRWRGEREGGSRIADQGRGKCCSPRAQSGRDCGDGR